MTLSLIIPVYNEIDQLTYTLRKLNKLKKKINKVEFIFIDDFSSDNTFSFLKNYQKNKQFIKLYRNKKKGLGSAIQVGIKKSKFDYVCIFMCDMSDDIKDVIKYYKLISKKNIVAVLGSRFIKNSKVKNYPIVKLFINRIANNLIKIIFLSKYNDFTNAFKIYDRKILLKLLPIVSESFNVFLELPLKIIARGYRYEIIPISWNGRIRGNSKFNMHETGSMYIFTLLYCFFEKILLNKRVK